ncbi:TetR/AcrR family transcriptional regulator [Patulibacter brassicae]|uniref:TetR/AcrR family transcriptional regulator n=1 Tax=Patulibacter brassicae TaxID=1705717 RepID=A0ABU4VIX0_9ACTN|nr:TetR/AcrR family transcriptional regulator [Patulibacter brassicae]MDX8150770.1 TetR/AcrR family transcriptional regulator [Patulibacter brassicae]
MSTARVYGGQTADERVRARRRQLLDAGLAQLGDAGWAGATVRGVCEAAGLSTRFFYESFANLEALAGEVYDEIAALVTEEILAAIAAVPADDRAGQADAAVRTMVDALTGDPRRARVLLVEAHAAPALAPRRAASLAGLAEIIATLGRERYPAGPDAEPTIRIAATLLAGGLSELMVAWVDGALPVDRERLVADCSALVAGFGDLAAEIAAGR